MPWCELKLNDSPMIW